MHCESAFLSIYGSGNFTCPEISDRNPENQSRAMSFKLIPCQDLRLQHWIKQTMGKVISRKFTSFVGRTRQKKDHCMSLSSPEIFAPLSKSYRAERRRKILKRLTDQVTSNRCTWFFRWWKGLHVQLFPNIFFKCGSMQSGLWSPFSTAAVICNAWVFIFVCTPLCLGN